MEKREKAINIAATNKFNKSYNNFAPTQTDRTFTVGTELKPQSNRAFLSREQIRI